MRGTASRLAAFITIGALVVAASQVDWGKFRDDDGMRKVTFTVTVGDGKVWAGGFKAIYTIGTRPSTVVVVALKGDNVKANTWYLTKNVKTGTAVSLRAIADWPTKPVTVQMRGPGVDPRPLTVISPHEPLIVGTVK